MKKCLLLKF